MSYWGDPDGPEPLPVAVLLEVLQWLALGLILAAGVLAYLGLVPVWEGVAAVFCGLGAGFMANRAARAMP